MRDRTSWYRGVAADLGRHWNGLPLELQETKPSLFCQIELALWLLERVAPGEAAEGAYTLLGGYPFARAMGFAVTEQDETALTAGRHLLWTLRRHRTWIQALETYQRFPERLRAYEVPPKEQPLRLSLTVADYRFAAYDVALSAPPPFTAEKFKLAPAGRSSFIERRRMASVTVPGRLVQPRPPGHDLTAGRRGDGSPLTVTWEDLLGTARWMDSREQEEGVEKPGHWESRLSEVRIALRDDDGKGFTERGHLRLDGLVHMVGMVGAGKSSLMILVAVWAARLARPLRTTLVVGDVAEQLRLSALLGAIGVPAVPVLGASTRENHVQRLHRRLASQGFASLLEHHDERFDQLSTVCVVDALRGAEASRPLRYTDAPCVSLHPESAGVEEQTRGVLPERFRAHAAPEPERPRVPAEDSGKAHGCPLWAACPRHQSAREQVEALVWIANPASLVQSAVPRHLNDERLRQLELACLQSDIVFVDEADAVQMRLDQLFAPSATLVQPGPDSWLDQLQTHKIEELSRQARLPLTDVEINRWNSALGVVSTATDVLYRTLIADEELRHWADMDYFSPWTLQEKLLADWFQERMAPEEPDGIPDEHELFDAYENDVVEPEPVAAAADARRHELTELFDAFRDDPLGRRSPYGSATDDMIDLTRDLLHSDSMKETRARTRTFLRRLLDGTPAPIDDEGWAETTCRRLEFMLLLSALHHRLDRLTFLWPQVEAALRLETTGNELARRPPLDYAPIIPESPMGNVLGFQYLPDERERDEDGHHSGTLRFFRCAGVGRELLHSLPHLGADPANARPGPHVVLMSGTSWAGASTRAHVTEPVSVVLKPSERGLAAVRRTTFSTRFLYDAEGHAMSLSGTPPKARPAAARALAVRLGSTERGGSASPLEQELALIEDDTRRRAILLVGSYKEAATVAAELHAMERWYGRVRVLAADDADLNAAVPAIVTLADQDGPVGVLRRGDLASFADDRSAEVLVAPLMAVERGHNILNAQRNAAFGTALFLARPHPRPDDLSLAVFAINDWTARFVRDQVRADDRAGPATFTELVGKAAGLNRAGLDFRYEARQEWRRLLSRRYIYSRLSDWEKRCFAWDQLVTMWQVIGRLVRGGVPARVVFVDAKFAPKTAAALTPGGRSDPAPARDGLLAGLRGILAPYFAPAADPAHFADPADPVLARLLYEPLYDALCNITHRT